MKLIDGHEVIEHAEVNCESREFIKKLTDYIEDADAVEPKQGEWKVHGEPPMYVKECSACGSKFFHHAMEDLTPYCAMCGARMRKGADDE